MEKINEKINNIISFMLMSVGTALLLTIFFKNSSQVPLVLHYIDKFGDYLGTRINLIYLIFGGWFLFFLNLYLAKIIKKLAPSLFLFINYSSMVIYFFFLILAMQLFFHNL